jgi:hypothetical protein
MWEEKKEEYKQTYAKSVKGFLHAKPKRVKVVESKFDGFKKMKFSGTHDDLREFKNRNIHSVIQQCSRRGVDRLYDFLYSCYLNGTLSADEWNCVENLIWNRGEELITEKMIKHENKEKIVIA